MMAYYLLLTIAGGAASFMGVAYILGGDVAQNILRLDVVAMKIALSGTILTLLFQVR